MPLILVSVPDGLLYGVTGPTGALVPQGFAVDLVEDERYARDIIAIWSPEDKVILYNGNKTFTNLNLMKSWTSRNPACKTPNSTTNTLSQPNL